jgi:hypothetical protein
MQGTDSRLIVDPNCEGNKKFVMTQKTEFEIEVNETVTYSRRSERFENFCPACRCMTEMATPQVGAILAELTEREIYRLVETGEIHFVETDRVLVCLNSLPGYQKNEGSAERS